MRLNLGCGTDILPGYINLDIAPLQGVDVVHDLNNMPLPFADCIFDEIIAFDVIKHIQFTQIMQEIYRIMTPGATLRIRIPHFTSAINYVDPTHKNHFSVQTFDFFQSCQTGRSYYFAYHFSRSLSRKITFMKGLLYFYNYPIEKLVNLSYKVQKYYEFTGLSRIFPAMNIELTLVK